MLRYLILFLFTFITSFAFSAQSIPFEKAQGKVEFLAVGRPSALKIKGEGSGINGELKITKDQASGTLLFDLTSLKTGISLRDEHMKEKYLQVGQYPTAQLEIKNLSLPQNRTGTNIPFKADLKLHGVTKTIDGTYNLEAKDKNMKLHAEFKIKVSDFQIEIPKYAGITVTDEVSVSVDQELKIRD